MDGVGLIGRRRALTEACGNDEALRQEVETPLSHAQHAESCVAAPAERATLLGDAFADDPALRVQVESVSTTALRLWSALGDFPL
jgi:hypothetical protein